MIFVRENTRAKYEYRGEVQGSEPCNLPGCEVFYSKYGNWIWCCAPDDQYVQVICPD